MFTRQPGRFEQSGLFTPYASRTLLLDPRCVQGRQLVGQLNRAGFQTDFVADWRDARCALGANDYHSCIVVADLDQSAHLKELDALRRAALRVWIIVLSDLEADSALVLAHRRGVDAVLSTPCSLPDLISRLSAFSLRARPTV